MPSIKSNESSPVSTKVVVVVVAVVAVAILGGAAVDGFEEGVVTSKSANKSGCSDDILLYAIKETKIRKSKRETPQEV